jgi:hypothetical protein
MYKNGNKPTAIYSFKHILCKFNDAINELGISRYRTLTIVEETHFR